MTIRRIMGIIALLTFLLWVKTVFTEEPSESYFIKDGAYRLAYALGCIFLLSSGYAKIVMLLNKKTLSGSLIGCVSLVLMFIMTNFTNHSYPPEQFKSSASLPALFFISSWFFSDILNMILPIEKPNI